MNDYQQLKLKTFEFLVEDTNVKLKTIETEIAQLTESRNSETKSTVGDKYETARAMAERELQQLKIRFARMKEHKIALDKIANKTENNLAVLGSLVTTNKFIYFLSIPYGKLAIDGTTVLVISPASPIGKLLLGKKVKDTFTFNGNKFEILEIE